MSFRSAVRPFTPVLVLFPGIASVRWSTAVRSDSLADIIIAALQLRVVRQSLNDGTFCVERERVHGSYHQDAESKTSPRRQGPPRVEIGRTGTPREQKQTHRPLLLADAQWLEDHDHARGVLAAVHHDPGRHLQG